VLLKMWGNHLGEALARAIAIRSGTQRLSGCKSELLGSGTRTEFDRKMEPKGSSDLRRSIVLDIQSDMRTGGSSTKESYFMILIICRDCSISSELPPRGQYERSEPN